MPLNTSGFSNDLVSTNSHNYVNITLDDILDHSIISLAIKIIKNVEAIRDHFKFAVTVSIGMKRVSNILLVLIKHLISYKSAGVSTSTKADVSAVCFSGMFRCQLTQLQMSKTLVIISEKQLLLPTNRGRDIRP